MTQKHSRRVSQRGQEKPLRQRRFLIAGFVGVLILVVAGFAVLHRQAPETEADMKELSTSPKVGALAPDFQLVSHDGEKVKLSDFRGRPVAITFMHTW